MIYSIDFETRSHANLPDVGLDIYANDPTTEVLCIAFGTTPDNVKVSGINQKPWSFDKLLFHVQQGGKTNPRALAACSKACIFSSSSKSCV